MCHNSFTVKLLLLTYRVVVLYGLQNNRNNSHVYVYGKKVKACKYICALLQYVITIWIQYFIIIKRYHAICCVQICLLVKRKNFSIITLGNYVMAIPPCPQETTILCLLNLLTRCAIWPFVCFCESSLACIIQYQRLPPAWWLQLGFIFICIVINIKTYHFICARLYLYSYNILWLRSANICMHGCTLT